MASIFMRLHVSNPRPWDRFLRFYCPLFLRLKKKCRISPATRCLRSATEGICLIDKLRCANDGATALRQSNRKMATSAGSLFDISKYRDTCERSISILGGIAILRYIERYRSTIDQTIVGKLVPCTIWNIVIRYFDT